MKSGCPRAKNGYENPAPITNLSKKKYISDVLPFQVLSKYVNALLNTKGGMLVFGVEPSGKIQW